MTNFNSILGMMNGGEPPVNPILRGLQSVQPPAPPPPQKKIKLVDRKGIKTGAFSEDTMKDIIRASHYVGVDPVDALAIAWQESNFDRKQNERGRSRRGLGQVNYMTPEQIQMLNEAEQQSGIPRDALKLAIAWKGKQHPRFAANKLLQYQAYNGLGVIRPEQFAGGKAYGMQIPKEGLDLSQTPLYGQTVQRLADSIKGNKEIMGLIAAERPQQVAQNVKIRVQKKT